MEWGKREGVRGQGGVRERGGGEVHSSFVGMHRPWARIGRGWGVYRLWARIGRGRVWVVGAYRAWARIVHGRVWVVGAYGSWVGSLLAVGGCYAWVRGCLVRGRS